MAYTTSGYTNITVTYSSWSGASDNSKATVVVPTRKDKMWTHEQEQIVRNVIEDKKKRGREGDVAEWALSTLRDDNVTDKFAEYLISSCDDHYIADVVYNRLRKGENVLPALKAFKKSKGHVGNNLRSKLQDYEEHGTDNESKEAFTILSEWRKSRFLVRRGDFPENFNKIAAIKEVREIAGLGLRKAKQLVDGCGTIESRRLGEHKEAIMDAMKERGLHLEITDDFQ